LKCALRRRVCVFFRVGEGAPKGHSASDEDVKDANDNDSQPKDKEEEEAQATKPTSTNASKSKRAKPQTTPRRGRKPAAVQRAGKDVANATTSGTVSEFPPLPGQNQEPRSSSMKIAAANPGNIHQQPFPPLRTGVVAQSNGGAPRKTVEVFQQPKVFQRTANSKGSAGRGRGLRWSSPSPAAGGLYTTTSTGRGRGRGQGRMRGGGGRRNNVRNSPGKMMRDMG